MINIEKCKFYYQYNKPTIDEINSFIRNIKKKYTNELVKIEKLNNENLLNYNLKKTIYLIKYHKKIITDIIKEVVAFFPQISKIPHIIFIHGSFAKNLNRFKSDIDLNILYPNQFKNKILPIEELISIILQKIIGYSGRDKIHTMMLYTYNDSNNNSLESTDECQIIFPNNQIYKYQCRANYSEIMYKIKNSSREYNDFIKYVQKHIASNECEEWCYSYEIIYNNCENYNLYDDLNNIEENQINRKDYNSYDNLVKNLNKEIQNYKFDLRYVNTVSVINYNLKVRNFGFLYKTLALIKRYLFINEIKTCGLNFFEIFENKKFINLISIDDKNYIENSIFKYIWQISRIENLLSNNNINFSSRNYDNIDLFYVCELYNNLYHEDLINIQNEVTINFHKSLQIILKVLINKGQ